MEKHLCSIRTKYRILEQASELHERREQRHPNYQKPQLLATSPNQVWSSVSRDPGRLQPLRRRLDGRRMRERRTSLAADR